MVAKSRQIALCALFFFILPLGVISLSKEHVGCIIPQLKGPKGTPTALPRAGAGLIF